METSLAGVAGVAGWLGGAMKVLSVTKQTSTVRVLEIEASPEEFAEEENQAYARLRRDVKVPGFRPGKVPREVLRARYGKVAEADAVDSCVSAVLSEALTETNLVLLADPVIREVERTASGGVTFKAEVEVLPELDLPSYEKLQVVREVEEPSDEHVEERLEGLRQMSARVTVVDRPAQEGDVVRFSYRRLDPTGVPLVGTAVDDNSLVVGEREDLRPFWETMRGARAAETREFSVEKRVPDDAAATGATAREQRYSVTVKEVCERELPELDDEFARDIGRFGSLDELREHVRARLTEEAEETATSAAQDQLLRTVVDKSAVEAIPSLVERHLSSVVEEAREEHHARGDGRPFDENHIREAHRSRAKAEVAEYLVVRRIAHDEGLEPSEEEVRSFVARVTGRQPTADELATSRGRLREFKVRDFLMTRAKVKDVKRKASAKGGRILTP
jgi:trigger factor